MNAYAASSSSDVIGRINIKVPDLGQLAVDLYIVALFAASIFFLVQLAIGGLSWMASGGDEKALKSARGRITNAVIGLVIVVAAAGISIIITSVLGINIFKEGGISITPPKT